MSAIHGALFAVAVWLVFAAHAQADYLEVRREASVKDQPARDAAVLERPDVGSFLVLVDEGRQTNGYYRVVSSAAGRQGWIYRTFVRRYRGALPGGAPVVQPGTIPPPALVQGGSAMRAHFINVGQGNAALLEFSCGTVLIDAGGFDADTTDHLIEYLQAVFSRREDLNNTISAVFLSHPHIDHNRALRTVVETFTVENYIHNGDLGGRGPGGPPTQWMVQNAANHSINVKEIQQPALESLPERSGFSDSAVDPLDCDVVDPQIRVLASAYTENPGWPAGAYDNRNNGSVVVRIDFGQASFLFTGDLEEDAIEELVKFYEGTSMLDVDLYHVGHHGSYNGTTDSLMQSMTPSIAIMSMGDMSNRAPWTAWRYGHPRRDTIEILDRWIDRPRSVPSWVDVATGVQRFMRYLMNDAIYGTGWDGDITVTADSAGNFYVATTQAPGS